MADYALDHHLSTHPTEPVNLGIYGAACDAWSDHHKSTIDTGKLTNTAQTAFDKEVNHQIKESLSALFRGPVKAVKNTADSAKTFTGNALEVLSIFPDDAQILIGSIYDKPHADLHSDELSTKLRDVGSKSDKLLKSAQQAYEPIETDLESIGASGDYGRLLTDPIRTSSQAWNSFTNQSAPKQVEDITYGITQNLILTGVGKVANDAFDVIKAQELIAKAQNHIAKLDSVIDQFDPPAATTPEGVLFKKYVFNGEKTQLSAPKAAERLDVNSEWLKECTGEEVEALGIERVEEYRKTFFEGHPLLYPFEKQIVVHHAIEQQVLCRYPGLFSAKEVNDLSNLRGIPKCIEPKLHRQEIREAWDDFYILHPKGCLPNEELRRRFLQEASEIDRVYGGQFEPPVK